MEIALKFFWNILFITYIKYIGQKLNTERNQPSPWVTLYFLEHSSQAVYAELCCLLDGKLEDLGVAKVETELKPIILRLVENTAQPRHRPSFSHHILSTWLIALIYSSQSDCLLFNYYFYFMCMVFCFHLLLCTTYLPGAHRGWKRVLDSLGLEWQIAETTIC